MRGSTPGPGPDTGPVIEPPTVTVGAVVGTYRLLRQIGKGATGQVFEVEHVSLGRRAAMKVLAPEHASRRGAIKRLFTEARAVNRISNPHIVEVTDVIEAEGPDGVNAIVMELLEGASLAQTLAAGRMASKRFLPILAQIADGLAAAHNAGFVHRDLKPENIFLTSPGGRSDFVKLLDFGLVKSIQAPHPSYTDEPSARKHATADGVFVGTPAYASPEQASGRPVDHRTDIYSLGIIVYELLCGRLPFQGRNFGEYLVKHLTEDPPPAPPDATRTPMGRALETIARRCLSKEVERRFGSAAELRDLFERLASGDEIPPHLVGVAPPSPWRQWFIGGAAVAAIAAGALYAFSQSAHVDAVVETPRAASVAARRGPTVEPLVPDQMVVVRFRSNPEGAETRPVGKPDLLGITPFARTFPMGAGIEVEMTLPGFLPGRTRVSLAGDTPEVEVRLRPTDVIRPPIPGRPTPPDRRKKEKPSRNGTLDPFDL